MKHIATLIIAALFPAAVFAANAGETLPALKIDNKGELVLSADNTLSYAEWDSAALDTQKKVQIVQYMAARPSSEKDANLFTDALKAAGLSRDTYHLTSIINVTDVPFGMSSMAMTEIGKNKIEHPHTSFVIDYTGQGLKTLALQPKSMSLYILDESGKILFTNTARLTSSDVEQAISIIRGEVAQREMTATTQIEISAQVD